MGAENGVLIRNGAALQTLKDLDTIVFDKTGTITKGKPEVTDIIPFEGFSEKEVIRLAASVEVGSEHPLGEAILRKANELKLRLPKITSFEALLGRGVKAKINSSLEDFVIVGNRKLMNEENIDFKKFENVVLQLEQEAKTVMLIASGRGFVGIIAGVFYQGKKGRKSQLFERGG